MSKKVKIFEDEKQIYEGILTINTAILKGQIYENPKQSKDSTHFKIRMSNGKTRKQTSGIHPLLPTVRLLESLAMRYLKSMLIKMKYG